MILIKARFDKAEKLTTKKKLTFSTDVDITELEFLQSIGTDGFLAFNSDEFRSEVKEIIKNKKIGINDLGVTPSERLRKVLFLVAESKGILDFEDFYKEEMDRIISHYQTKYL